MQDKPDARELVKTTAEFIRQELAPTLTDPRLRFRALIAANVLSVVARELDLAEGYTAAEWRRLNALFGDDAPGENLPTEIDVMTRALCAKIRAGDADHGDFRNAALAHIKQTVIEKLLIANPSFLERVSSEL